MLKLKIVYKKLNKAEKTILKLKIYMIYSDRLHTASTFSVLFIYLFFLPAFVDFGRQILLL